MSRGPACACLSGRSNSPLYYLGASEAASKMRYVFYRIRSEPKRGSSNLRLEECKVLGREADVADMESATDFSSTA